MKAFGGASSNTTTLISEGTEIVGDVKFYGNLEIEGKICGNVMAIGNGDAIVRVSENGIVEGNIEVPIVVINGSVQGNILADSHLKLAANARVEGDVQYSLIEMEKGAHIYGRLFSHDHQSSKENVSSDAAIEVALPEPNKSNAVNHIKSSDQPHTGVGKVV